MKFEDLNLSPELLKAIDHLGLTEPTEIQEKSIPLVLARKDVIGESATGSGKTLVFGCGILDQVVPNRGLQALVLVPTRELAEQVKDSLNDFSHNRKLKIIAVYGGVSMGNQVQGLKRSEVVVATPGRLLDHLNHKTINISQIKLLVLDEADRMLDMGFIKSVERIMQNCPKRRQTLFFSATISSDIKDLAKKYMIDQIKVSAEKLVDPNKLKQVYYNINRGLKLPLLVNLLQQEKSGLVMVFCNMRVNTDFVARNLKVNKIDATSIHGGLAQNKRTKMMSMFNNGKIGVLVCTDVAARGLHIENVSHIYNYEIPKDPKDYVHRIGRTARAGENGIVVNLLSEQDHDNFSRIIRDYNSFKIEKINTPRLERVTIIKNIGNGRPVNRFHERDRNNNYRSGHKRGFEQRGQKRW